MCIRRSPVLPAQWPAELTPTAACTCSAGHGRQSSKVLQACTVSAACHARCREEPMLWHMCRWITIVPLVFVAAEAGGYTARLLLAQNNGAIRDKFLAEYIMIILAPNIAQAFLYGITSGLLRAAPLRKFFLTKRSWLLPTFFIVADLICLSVQAIGGAQQARRRHCSCRSCRSASFPGAFPADLSLGHSKARGGITQGGDGTPQDCQACGGRGGGGVPRDGAQLLPRRRLCSELEQRTHSAGRQGSVLLCGCVEMQLPC
jgi:RTA1 like protein